jgi:Aminoglycoside-2''-adenylyltransferase
MRNYRCICGKRGPPQNQVMTSRAHRVMAQRLLETRRRKRLRHEHRVPWWITGGWAIDLAVAHVTRDHADVDVMMLERDEHALRGRRPRPARQHRWTAELATGP